MASNLLNRLRKLEGATNAERPLSPEEFEVSGDSATASKQAQLGSAQIRLAKLMAEFNSMSG